jgi:hypothetical protein
MEKLREMEAARQEMKRRVFEKLPEVADSLSEHIVFIGNKYTTPNQGFYDLVNWLNGAWYAWQAAQEQVLQTLCQDKRNGFFSYDGFGNYSQHDNLLEAKREAELAIDYFADQLSDGSFHPDGNGNFQDVGYGVILGTSSYSVDHVVTQDDVDNGEYSYPVGTEILSLNLVDLVCDQPQKADPNAFLSAVADMTMKLSSGDYALVPKEIPWTKADDLASAEWDKHKELFLSEHRDMTAFQVEESRLRWCRNKAHQFMDQYKTLIATANQ